MITISLGNPGSGKTVCTVKDMYLNKSYRKTYSNILTNKLKNCIPINANMIIKKEVIGQKKKRDGSTEDVIEYKLNKEYWEKIKEPIDVVIDEAHTILNARRSMSKVNQIITDWLSLIRRVLGSSDSGYGTLTLISQLPNRIDIIAREMATKVKWHLCHYIKSCKKCGYSWREDSNTPEQLWHCERCGNHFVKKHTHVIEVWHFANMGLYLNYKEFGIKTYHKHYFITDIEKYFPLYNSLQWENMFSEFY